MKALENAGIAVFLQLHQFNANLPASEFNGSRHIHPDYNVHEYFFAVVDEFTRYPNTLGFYLWAEDAYVPMFQWVMWKAAAIRDIKAYLKKKQYRQIPVGIGITHHNFSDLASFLNCGDSATAPDYLFFDVNWDLAKTCPDPTSWAATAMIDQYRNYSIPSWFLYGCGKNTRTENLEDVAYIYRNESLEVFSGGVFLEYSQNWGANEDFGMFFVRVSNLINSFKPLSMQREHPSFQDQLFGRWRHSWHQPILRQCSWPTTNQTKSMRGPPARPLKTFQ
jgi:hypothetical protein